MARKYNRDLILNGNINKAILSIAVPIVINSFIQTMYNLTDTYWLGRIGTDPMAAITLVSPVQNIIMNFGSGITAAGAILVSQYIGAKEDKQAKSMTNHIFVCSMIFSIVCATLCFVATPGIITWLKAEGDIYRFSKTYLQTVVLDMPFLFMINIFAGVNQAQGDTIRPMLLNFLGVAINLILDPLFLVVFNWGVFGAAFATLLAKVPCAIIAFILLSNKKNAIHLKLKGFRFEKEKILSIIKIGLPTAIGGSTMQFGFLLMSKNVYKYGAFATAAYGIGNKINGLISLPSNGIGSATSTIVGQNIGAKQHDRAKLGYRKAMHMAVCFLFVGGLILSRPFIAKPIVSIFSDDAEVIRMATDFLSLMAICCWTNGIYNSTMGLFQGSGHTMVTMAVDATRLWVFRFMTLFVCENLLHMGVSSIWYSVVVSNALSSLVLYILYRTNIWRKEAVKIKRSANPAA